MKKDKKINVKQKSTKDLQTLLKNASGTQKLNIINELTKRGV